MSDITPQTIADRLQKLAAEMLDTAAEMDYFGGFSPIGQHGKELAGAAVVAQSWADGIREDYPAEDDSAPEQPTDRSALQAAGTHPAPCARHCEANAYQIEIRRISAERDALAAKQAELEGQSPIAYANGDELDNITDDRVCVVLGSEDGFHRTAVFRRPISSEPVNKRLLDVATGEVQHIYAGLCPDAGSGSISRDPECPACRAISAAEALQIQPQAKGGGA